MTEANDSARGQGKPDYGTGYYVRSTAHPVVPDSGLTIGQTVEALNTLDTVYDTDQETPVTDTIERGRWYPAPAPALPGETDDTYTDRLTGADGTSRRPYDHDRRRQCSIGYHTECSARIGGGCGCPCHFDVGVPADADVNAEAAEQIAALYDLPDTTGRRVMFEAAKALRAGEANNAADLVVVLGRVYDSAITEGFAIDVFNIHAHYAAAEPRPGAAG